MLVIIDYSIVTNIHFVVMHLFIIVQPGRPNIIENDLLIALFLALIAMLNMPIVTLMFLASVKLLKNGMLQLEKYPKIPLKNVYATCSLVVTR
jgi:hypothetical protein